MVIPEFAAAHGATGYGIAPFTHGRRAAAAAAKAPDCMTAMQPADRQEHRMLIVHARQNAAPDRLMQAGNDWPCFRLTLPATRPGLAMSRFDPSANRPRAAINGEKFAQP
jgi:hypothetical protein